MSASFVKILAYPHSAIRKRTKLGFLVCDRFADLFGGGSDAIGFRPEQFESANPTVSLDWITMPMLKSISNLGFIQFVPDGTAVLGAGQHIPNARAGIYIQPRIAPLDCKIGNNREDIDGGNFDLNWDAERGTWNTYLPLAGSQSGIGTMIMNTGGDVTAIARTRGTIAANRCFQLDIEAWALSAGGPQQGLRYEWGGEWALVIRQNQKATIERKALQANGQLGWAKVKTLSLFPSGNLLGGRYRITIMRLDGRLVVLLEGKNGGQQGMWILDQKAATVKTISWMEARHRVTAYNCRVHIGVSLVKWADAGDNPLTGTLEREVQRKTPISDEASTSIGGWRYEGTTADITTTAEELKANYVLTLRANSQGLSSPFVDRASVRFKTAYTTPTGSPLDLRPGCTALRVSLALPPQCNGAEATLEFDRDLLANKVPGWQDVAAQWCPVEIQILRTGADYTTVFSGYIYKPDKDTGTIGDRMMTIVCRDNILRLSKSGETNHALVDHRYPPLDLLFAEKFNGTSGGYGLDGLPLGAGGALYGGECVQELIRIALGDYYADQLNGNGDPKRYISATHPPLISMETDRCGYLQLESALTGQPLTENNFIFPVPHGDAVLDWINGRQIGQADRCIFFFRGDTPYYGRYYNLIGGGYSTVRTVRDSDTAGGLLTALTRITLESRPDRDPNRVYVVSPQQSGLEGLLPGARLAQDNLPSSDARSASRTWERSLFLREPWAQISPEAIATGIISQLTGVRIEQPAFYQRGDERWKPGDIIQPILDGPVSDQTLDLDDYYRVERIDHIVTFSEGTEAFATQLTPRPLTAQERAAL